MSAPEAAQPVAAQPPTAQASGPPAAAGQPSVSETSLGRKRSLSPQKDERASKVFRKDPKELDLRVRHAFRILPLGRAECTEVPGLIDRLKKKPLGGSTLARRPETGPSQAPETVARSLSYSRLIRCAIGSLL